jgi:hypothetical protein
MSLNPKPKKSHPKKNLKLIFLEPKQQNLMENPVISGTSWYIFLSYNILKLISA